MWTQFGLWAFLVGVGLMVLFAILLGDPMDDSTPINRLMDRWCDDE